MHVALAVMEKLLFSFAAKNLPFSVGIEPRAFVFLNPVDSIVSVSNYYLE